VTDIKTRDNISSGIVSLEKGVVLYGANALSLLPVVLFVSIG